MYNRQGHSGENAPPVTLYVTNSLPDYTALYKFIYLLLQYQYHYCLRKDKTRPSETAIYDAS